ncbi:MAG: tail fiber domain-containing protein [Saprospiraceae bacterium]|nr:tail fiber domain-containing protein [Saprospiraceae bacterium]
MKTSTCLPTLTLLILITAGVHGQNVGIATTSPQALLHVWNPGQVNTPGGMVILGNTDEAHLELDFNTIQSSFGPLGHLDLSLNPAGGDIGIQTFFPQAPLHVYSAGLAPTGGGLGIFGDANAGHLEVDYDRLQASSGGAFSTLRLQQDGGDLNVGNGLIFADRSLDRVGINTQNPLHDLHVVGTAFVTSTVETNDLIANDDVFVADYLTHFADNNTELWLTSDRMRFYCGGLLMLDMEEAASDVVRVGSNDVDVNICEDNLFINGSVTPQVGIGTTAPDAALHIKMGNSLNSGLLLENSSTLQDWRFLVNGNADIDLFWQDNLRGRFDDATGNYTPMSDARFKEEIRSLQNGLETLRRLRPVSYLLVQDTSRQRHAGFLAQEVLPVLPQAVLHDTLTDRYTLSYTEISVVTVKAVQELADQVERLEASNARLRSENEKLHERLTRLEALAGLAQNNQ